MFFGFYPESGPLYVMADGLLYGSLVDQAVSSGQALRLKGHASIGFTQTRLFQRSHPGAYQKTEGGCGLFQVLLPLHDWRVFLDQLADQGDWGESQRQRLHQQITFISQVGEFDCSYIRKSLISPMIMGVLNVTPDSFSDGSRFNTPTSAVEHVTKMLKDGADIIDIGGESTRPGAKAVSVQEEADRVIPVIHQIRQSQDVRTAQCFISLDTRHSQIMKDGLSVGIDCINDVMALQGQGSLAALSHSQEPVILMHMRGDPVTMQRNPTYQSVLLDIYDWLENRIVACQNAGVRRARVIVDPGIGFGKSLVDNLRLMYYIRFFHGLGVPILLGASRKSFIGRVGESVGTEWDVSHRLPGSLWAVQTCLQQAVQLFRVHDVAETDQLRKIWLAGQAL